MRVRRSVCFFTIGWYCIALAGCTNQQPSEAHFHQYLVVNALRDSGAFYAGRNNCNAALKYYKAALAKSQRPFLPEQQSHILLDMAGLLENNNPDTSLFLLANALRIAHGIHYHELESEIYRTIAGIHKQRANYKEAVSALEEHNRLTDSISEQNRLRDIAFIKASEKGKQQFISIYIIAIALVIVVVILAITSRRTTYLNKQLKGAVDIRDKLFSVIGHDLRGPAGNLVQGLELIDTNTLSKPKEHMMLDGLLKQARSLTDTLTTLLTWARTQLKGIVVRPQQFDPKEAVTRTVRLLEGHLEQKRIALSINIPAGLSVYTDRDQFDFIVRNLLSNAIKFSPVGGPVEIAAETMEKEIIFSVRDHGIGMSDERQAQFIEHKMESSVGTAGEKGTGLGLMLAKDFIQSANGRIWLESELGKGSVFFFTIGTRKPAA